MEFVTPGGGARGGRLGSTSLTRCCKINKRTCFEMQQRGSFTVSRHLGVKTENTSTGGDLLTYKNLATAVAVVGGGWERQWYWWWWLVGEGHEATFWSQSSRPNPPPPLFTPQTQPSGNMVLAGGKHRWSERRGETQLPNL